MNEDELYQFEQKARGAVAAGLRATLDQLHATLLIAYTATAGSTRHKLPEHAQATLRRHLAEVLERLDPPGTYADARAVLSDAARRAMRSGAAGTGLGQPVARTLPIDVRWALREMTSGMKSDLAVARRLVRRGRLDRWGDVAAVLGAARKALNRADRAATYAVNRSHNAGVQRAVDRAYAAGLNVSMVWRAERDACVLCSGYAGSIAVPGEPFRPVFEVADPSARPDGRVMSPPVHPFCRCGLEPWFGATEDAELGPLDLPYALRREAQRAVLTGQAQGSEPARLRAADRLARLADLLVPRTVTKRARRAVAAGTFER